MDQTRLDRGEKDLEGHTFYILEHSGEDRDIYGLRFRDLGMGMFGGTHCLAVFCICERIKTFRV